MGRNKIRSDRNACVGVLINPLSGGNLKGFGPTRKVIGDDGKALCREVRTPREIHRALFDFARHGVDLVVVSGGDGTVQAVLTVLFHHQPFESPPRLVILSSGTTSMIAGDVGAPGNAADALKRLFRWARTGRGAVSMTQRPILRLQVPGHDVRYGMFFGAAGISRGIEYYQRNLHVGSLRGKVGICLTLARFFWAIVCKQLSLVPATPIGVGMAGQPVVKSHFMIMFVSTLDRLFFGLRPFWGNDTGPLHYTAVKSRHVHLLKSLPFLIRGHRNRRGTPENGYDSRNVGELRLHLDSSVALDGQIYTPSSAKEPTLLRYGGKATFLRV